MWCIFGVDKQHSRKKIEETIIIIIFQKYTARVSEGDLYLNVVGSNTIEICIIETTSNSFLALTVSEEKLRAT